MRGVCVAEMIILSPSDRVYVPSLRLMVSMEGTKDIPLLALVKSRHLLMAIAMKEDIDVKLRIKKSTVKKSEKEE